MGIIILNNLALSYLTLNDFTQGIFTLKSFTPSNLALGNPLGNLPLVFIFWKARGGQP